MVNIIFLDIDGVLNYQFKESPDREYSRSERFGLAQDLVDNLRRVVDAVSNVKIVIISTWRSFRIHEDVHKSIDWRCILEHMLGDGMSGVILGDIGMTYEFGSGIKGGEGRAKDIKAWIESNRNLNIGSYVIINDECSTVKRSFPNNVVDCECSMCNGLTEAKAKEAIWILTNFGKDRKMTQDTWFIADTHFYHANIIKYCNRPWNKGFDDKHEMVVDDECVREMNDEIIRRWNAVVKRDDIVWMLGDFCFGKRENVQEVFPKLNGRINLVMGNHDHHKVEFYQSVGFHRVYDRPVIINKFVILSHAPLEFLNSNCPFYSVFGHIHDSDMYKTFTKNSCCVCVERHNYTPVSWKTIQDECEKLNSGS